MILPISQAAYAYHHDLTKGLAIYLYLKFYSNSKISRQSPVFTQLRKDLQIKDQRTLDKHLSLLIDHKWISYSTASGIYFLRGKDYIRQLHEFRSRQGVEVTPKDLSHFQVFLAAVIIGKEVNDQRFYWDVAKRRGLKKAPDKWLGAKHSAASSYPSKRPDYFGLCNKTIARLLGCKQTRACVLKHKAAELGYLKISHRYKDIIVLDKPDFALKTMLYEQFAGMEGRVRAWRIWVNGEKYVKFLLQLHDEISCHLIFKRIEKYNAIHLPKEQAKSITIAAANAA